MSVAAHAPPHAASVRVLAVRLLLAALVLVFAISFVTVGTYPMSLGQILGTLAGSGSDIERMIVIDHRLPRILVAIGAGAAFGLSGALFQTMLRNPLASPDWIGFTSGASFGALVAVALTGGFVLIGAVTGVVVAACLILALAWRSGFDPYRLVLIGIGVNLSIAAAAELLLARVDLLTATEMVAWLVGSLNARDWTDVTLLGFGLIVLVPMAIWLGFPLVRMGMSDDIARGLGLPLMGLRLMVATVGIGFVALAVCVAGPLPFVAFVAAPIARGLEGGGGAALPTTALVGALIVLCADFAARSVPLVALPAGVFTAMIGAPVLIGILFRQLRGGDVS
ncbi:MAG: iron chelate uptake ABC transporter family permease subunit [Pseudomonadota bacterium]